MSALPWTSKQPVRSWRECPGARTKPAATSPEIICRSGPSHRIYKFCTTLQFGSPSVLAHVKTVFNMFYFMQLHPLVSAHLCLSCEKNATARKCQER
jgi:hypothetical protein